jgi:hypothetical protein
VVARYGQAVTPGRRLNRSADSLGDSTLTERVVVRHSYGARGFPPGHLGVLSGARSGPWYETAPCRNPKTVLRDAFCTAKLFRLRRDPARALSRVQVAVGLPSLLPPAGCEAGEVFAGRP